MLKNLKRLCVAASMLATIVGVYADSPKREMRSTWLTTVWAIDWPSTQGATASAQTKQKSEMTQYLDDLKDCNFTSTCFQVRSMGDAMYPSEYAPWSSYISGTRGTNPGWDPLAYFVEEAHKRGLEAYVWLNPYRWSSGTTWSTAMDQEWQNSGMLIAGDDASYITFNPGLAETRELIVNIIKEILANYKIDGIIFDDYFYPSGGTTEGSSAPDYDTYKSSGTTLSMGDWRRANVNQMVKDVYDAIQATRPDVRFGISPAGVSSRSASKYGISSPSKYGVSASDWQYDQIYSDPLTWMAEGTIDFISPQCYWLTNHSTAPFGPLTEWWHYANQTIGKTHYYASHSVSYIGTSDTQSNWNELVKQINYNREYSPDGVYGSIYYSHKNVTSGTRSLLKQDTYSRPALVPVIDWKTKTNYGKVSNLTSTGSTLSWSAVTNGNAIIRYTVYAIPTSVTLDAAQMSNGDGISNEYLLGVSYATTYSVPTNKQGNFYYAVCVYDGYGNEFEPALVGYPSGESEKTTLVSPVGGASTAWSQTFSWSSVSDATYTIEISDNSSFSTIKYQQSGITTNSCVVNLGDLTETTTYYWRVRTSQSGKLESVSSVETFKTPARPSAPKTSLLTPSNGANFEADFTMTWSAVDCEQYILEVATSNDFSTIKYSKTLTTTSHDMVISLLGKGTFYWRVTTAGKTVKSTVSDVRSFNISKVVVGSFEPGYSIIIDKDNASYAKVGDVKVNSIWFRSVDENYENITYPENGSYNRSFCVGNDYVYVTGRTENNSEASIYLRKYDQKTGELVSDVFLGTEGQVAYYPCNTVVKDSKGNICIANLSLNAGSSPVVLHLVNTETGALTQVASLTVSGLSSARADHISLTGDVVAGNFKVYQAVAKGTTVVRWTYENGQLTNTEKCNLQSLYPSSASNLGIAPRVLPIDDNSFLLVGGDTFLSRYTFSTGAMTDSFANKTSLAPVGYEANGGTFFTLNGTKYIVYPYSDYNASNGHTFNFVKVNSNMDFSSMELMWNLPKAGIGAVNSSTYQVDADYLPINDGSGILYLFVPGNGLCAYEVIDSAINGVEDITAETSITVSGNNIAFGAMAQSIEVYGISGNMVVSESNVTSVELNVPAGVYIVKAIINGNVTSKKLIVK